MSAVGEVLVHGSGAREPAGVKRHDVADREHTEAGEEHRQRRVPGRSGGRARDEPQDDRGREHRADGERLRDGVDRGEVLLAELRLGGRCIAGHMHPPFPWRAGVAGRATESGYSIHPGEGPSRPSLDELWRVGYCIQSRAEASEDRPRVPERGRPARGGGALCGAVRARRARAGRGPGHAGVRLRAVLARARARGAARSRPHGLAAAAVVLAGRGPRAPGGDGRCQLARTRATTLVVRDPEGFEHHIVAHRDDGDHRPAIARQTSSLAGLRPAQARPRQPADRRPGGDDPVPHRRARDGDRRLPRRRRHLVPRERRAPPDGAGAGVGAALPPSRVRLLRFRHAAEPLRQRRPARPLARMGAAPARHRAEHLRLRADHRGAAARRVLRRHGAARARPRAAALARRPLLVEHVGAAAPALLLPLRRPRPSATSATASRCWARSSLPWRCTPDGDDRRDRGGPHRRAVPRRAARRRPRDLAERREDHPPARASRARGGRADDGARLRPPARARRRDARAGARHRRARERHPPHPALEGGPRAAPARGRADGGADRRDDGPDARLPERDVRLLRRPLRRVGAARERRRARPTSSPTSARCATATSRRRTRS